MKERPILKPRHLLFVPVLLTLFACSEDAPPPQAVEVIVDQAKMVPHKPSASFVGRIQAPEDVKIQAQVTGYLKEWNFKEGDLIEKGAVLYQIDPAQYEADLSQAKANLAAAKATVTVSERNFSRGKELLPKGAISAAEMDEIEAKKLTAAADLQGAEAKVEAAEVNLSYTTIKAPIDGRIGRSKFSPGDLIGPDVGVLTSLVSIDPMQAFFQVSEQVFLAYVANDEKKRNEGEEPSKLEVKLEMADKSEYSETGHIDYVANRVDQDTGTIEARAVIPNPNGDLRPGQFVRVMLGSILEVDTLMVGQSAVQADQQGNYVFTVGADNKIVRSNVDVGARVGANVVISKGLEEGETVVIQGVQKVRAGQVVRTRDIDEPGVLDKEVEGQL
jgi:membrane fusion protein (multidrug efflux system)